MKRLIVLVLALGTLGYSQSVDIFPRSVSTVSFLPTSCERVGEIVWLTTASAGQNLYGSTTSGAGTCVWTVLSGTPGPQGVPGTSGTGSGTVTVVGAGVLTSNRIATGGGSQTIQTPSSAATADSSGNIIGTTFTTATGKPVPFGPTTTAVSNGVCWNSTTGLQLSDCGFVPVTNTRAVTTTSPLAGGGALSGNLSLTCPTCTVTIASGTTALASGVAIASGTCATTVTANATGAATTDTPTASANADISGVTGYTPISTGTLSIYPPWLTTNQINFKVCNGTTASITPGSVTLNWRVVR